MDLKEWFSKPLLHTRIDFDFINFQFLLTPVISVEVKSVQIAWRMAPFTLITPHCQKMSTMKILRKYIFYCCLLLTPHKSILSTKRVCLTRFLHSLHWTFQLASLKCEIRKSKISEKGFPLNVVLNCSAQQRVNMNKINISCLFLWDFPWL